MRITALFIAALVATSACKDTTGPPEPPRPADPILPAESRVVGLATSFQTTCALTADGALRCWGENRSGEFGNGTLAGSAAAVPSGGGLLFDFVAGSMGTSQMCGTTRAGVTYCWGYNVNGELGDGTTTNRSSPSRVDASVAFRALASSYHTCGLTTEGAAYCWGSGLGGQLGTGNDASQLRPARVQSSVGFKSITNGMQFSCALTRAGDAQCWGWGAGLGSGSADRSVSVPTPVSGGLTFRSISAGEEHVCAASTGGEVFCWGKLTPFYPDGFRAAPTRVPSSVPIVTVVSASRMTVGGASCGLTDAGEAYCWHSGLPPVLVPGGYRYAGLAGGHNRFCGYTPGGAAFCWIWERTTEGQVALTVPEPIPTL